MQIILQLKESVCKVYQAVAPGWLSGSIAPVREVSVETVERIIKLLQSAPLVSDQLL